MNGTNSKSEKNILQKGSTNDTSENVFSQNVGFSIQCFALNSSANRVIVAGRDLFKLFSIENDCFLLKSDYTLNRGTMSANVLRIMDICWSPLDETLVVSCGSNGELHKWRVTDENISHETSFRYHKRTINKVCFHPQDAHLLLSGDQDGHINLIDFRIKENPCSTFKHDSEDKVTDLQFNPTIRYQFASGSESGHICIWDTRHARNPEKKFKPHMKGVHLDWHPEERNLLATASKDRYIYIWDLNFSSQTPKHSLMHPDSIASIKWRPKNPSQIAACTSVIDARLYIWDLKRPYVPYASFENYQNFMWRNNPNMLIASVNSWLHNTSINNAKKPADHSTLVAVDIDKNGCISFAVGDVSIQEDKASEYGNSFNPSSYDSHKNNQQSDQLSYESESNKFRITKSKLIFDNEIMDLKSDWLTIFIKGYKFKNDTFENLCEHNARVALAANKTSIYKDWMILKTIYKNNSNELSREDTKNSYFQTSNEKSHGFVTRHVRQDSTTSITNSDGFHEASSPENNEFSCDEYNTKVEDEEYLLPNDIIEFNEVHELIDEYLNEKNQHQTSNDPLTASNNHHTDGQNTENLETNDLDVNFRLNILPKYHQPENLKLSFDKHFQNILFHYVEEESDLPTAITMLLAVVGTGKFQKSSIDDTYLNEWFSQYIELLAKFEMWNLRVEIIKAHQSEFIKNLTLNSINYNLLCANCKKPINKGNHCSKCFKNPFLCSFCHMPVKDLYIWCHSCCHGGHVNHLQEWFKKHNMCPTGCGCYCWNS